MTPQINSLVELTLPEVVEILAKRASELRQRPPTYAERTKLAASDVLSSVGSFLKDNPSVSHALVGGAAGAGIGGLGTMMGNEGREDGDRRSVMGSMLHGGLAGSALGGGIGMARQMMSRPGAGSEGMQPGEFSVPGQGRMRIDPKALRDNPGMAEEVRGLTAPPNPVDRGARAVFGNAWNTATKAVPGLNPTLSALGLTYGDGDTFTDQQLPFSSNVLPKAMLADAVLHSPLNTGDRLGLGRMSPEFAKDPKYLQQGAREIGEDMGLHSSVRDALSKDTANTPGTKGLKPGESRVPGAGAGGVASHVAGSGTKSVAGNSRWERFLNRLRGNYGEGGDTVLTTKYRPSEKETVTTNIGGDRDAGNKKLEREIPGNAETKGMTRSQARQAVEHGYNAHHSGGGKKDVPGLRNIFGRQYTSPSLGTRIGGRMLAYGAVPIAEYALGARSDDNARNDRLQQLIAQHAKKVGD